MPSTVYETSRAILLERYGLPEVLQLGEVQRPIPTEDQVLVRVRAASVNPFDWHSMRGLPYLVRVGGGLRRPKNPRLGADVAGVVESIGAKVTGLRPGDEVFGMSVGTFGEHVAVSEIGLAPKPANLGFEEAAAVPLAGLTALQGLRDKGHIRAGHRVLINGASGGVGTFAVQIAKSYGAVVTGVCSTRNIDMVHAIGADHVIDYTKDDFTRGGQRYDLILDTIVNHPLREYSRILTENGALVLVGGGDGNWIGPFIPMANAAVLSRLTRRRMLWFLARRDQGDLVVLKELAESGNLVPVIDRKYTLDQVPEAIGYLEKGHARGKVVITV